MPDNYVTLFRIVPMADGYHYMCKNCFNQFYLAHKAEDPLSTETLLFETEELAETYIDKYLKVSETMKIYKPEFVLYLEDCIPAQIIKEVN